MFFLIKNAITKEETIKNKIIALIMSNMDGSKKMNSAIKNAVRAREVNL